MTAKKRGLGRGLDALLSTSASAAARHEKKTNTQVEKELQQIPIEYLKPGYYQPRKEMAADALEELADSIKVQGIIQPIVVRPLEQNRYEIIAGERRWRAAQIAKLEVVPCLIKDVPDEAVVAIALIENIQREDLNPLEEAVAFQRLIDEFSMTHQKVADAVGKSRTTITNLLRINQLNKEVKVHLERGDIDLGHAKVLLAVEGELQNELAKIIVAKGLTVREAEKLVNKALAPNSPKQEQEKDPDVKLLEQKLAEKLGAKVNINYNRKGKGKLVINYTSLDELDGILKHFS